MRFLLRLIQNTKNSNMSKGAGQTHLLSDKVLTNKGLFVKISGARGGGAVKTTAE
ncbi:hypothetical protein [Pseudoalteromonas sp. T1lg23B]|uniref:hypothetical protein n=1 Tax=Pseudoalteromonas sp. T1lg23B TaxID=2077097 RepID=UPI001319BF4F|nr:hypothetical protein [Pseudoalteromonas sp. T1lg23B]